MTVVEEYVDYVGEVADGFYCPEECGYFVIGETVDVVDEYDDALVFSLWRFSRSPRERRTLWPGLVRRRF